MALPIVLSPAYRYYQIEMDDVSAEATAYVVAGGRGHVEAIYTVLHGAITTADSILTPKINGTAMTMGGKKLSSAAVVAGGSGYSVGDIITLAGGKGAPAKVAVDTLSGSAVATVTVPTAGDYSEVPADPVAQAFVGPAAGQTGATFNLTMLSNDAAITVATASSAAGDIDSCFPSGANTVQAGDKIELASDGGSETTMRLSAVVVVREY
jgi:hypothetical protein